MNKGFRLFSHIFVMALCAAAIALYFILPLWSISATYTVSAAQIKTMLGSSFEGYDLDDALPKSGVDVHIKLNINVPVLFAAAFSSGNEAVSQLVEDNVDGIVDELVSTIGDVTKTATKSFVKETIKTEIKNQIKDYLTNSSSGGSESDVESEAQEILDELDKDGFVDESADKIVDALYAEGATVDSVTDTAVNIVEEAVDKLRASGNEKVNDITLDEETKQEIREAIEKEIAQFADENGVINMDETMQQYLLDALNGLLNQYGDVAVTSSEEKAVSFGADLTSADTEVTTTTETTTATKDEIRNALKSYIDGIIPSDVMVYIQAGLIGVFAIFMISLLCWVYVLIKSIVKLICGKDGAKLKAPIIFGWLPALIFMFIPSLVYFIVKLVEVNDIIAALSISFFSSGICAAVAAVLLIIFSIVSRCVKSDVGDEN